MSNFELAYDPDQDKWAVLSKGQAVIVCDTEEQARQAKSLMQFSTLNRKTRRALASKKKGKTNTKVSLYAAKGISR